MYNHRKIEKKWSERWIESGLYKTRGDDSREKFYILDMFPYPSGAGLHVGHPKGYIATDIFARMKTMQGFNVLHPMGWDAFGLPAENFALKNKVHPKISTDKNIETFKSQLGLLGLSYDWDREINTTDPKFYKWTQWIFLKLFEKGLAYESYDPINWCPSCKTGLANEDLEGGKCERCDSEIERKPMRQWVLKITDYADRMLDDLEKLPDWDDSIREMQKNWIGRSEGAHVDFKINKETVTVFTTRPDTLFGATYFVLSPEHPLVDKLTTVEQKNEVNEYRKQATNKSDLDRTELAKDKTGVFTGAYAINPVNNEEIPVWIADYVLMSYGTGAIMAVPAHDERDSEFADKYNIQKIQVVKPTSVDDVKDYVKATPAGDGKDIVKKIKEYQREAFEKLNKGELVYCYINEGLVTNSGFLDGLKTDEAKTKIIDWLEEKKLGTRAINYKLRDWVFSRQRYWGEPIPIVHCEKCGAVPLPENELPLELPDVEHYEPSGTGESPLTTIDEWVNTTCPKCGDPAKRETNTMPQWAGSSWYYLRFIDPNNDKALMDKKKEKYWSPVDFYVGGAEHATRHLIYARFWHKFLFDIGVVSHDEPFKRLQHVGLIMAEDGRKMSKRWGNVINPNDIVKEYGADAMRVYEMFMGPFSQSCAWNTRGLVGARKFLEKIWKIKSKVESQKSKVQNKKLLSILHKTIKKVGGDIEGFKFNTAISTMMIFANAMEKEEIISKDNFEKFLIILAPFAPHFCEEIWTELRNTESVFKQDWPKFDENLACDEMISLVIQVNGKLRDTIEVEASIKEEKAKEIALDSEKIKTWTDGKEIVKVIYVKGKLVSIVAK
jgi:leucyl-tRNA synthetase